MTGREAIAKWETDRLSVHGSATAMQERQLRSFLATLPAFVAATRMPPEEHRRIRTQRLRKLIAVAKARSPWHARRLAHIDPRHISESEIDQIPAMTKSDLMENFDDILTDRSISLSSVERHIKDPHDSGYLCASFQAIVSGGSCGRRGVFAYDRESWATFGLSSARPIALMLENCPEARDVAVALVSNSAIHASTAFTRSFAPWLTSQFRAFVPLPMTLPFEMLVERLNEIEPTSLSGYPSLIYQLALAARKGQLRMRPRLILTGAEPLLADQKVVIEQAFGARIGDFYGCSEASCLGFSCLAGNGLHLCEDTAILEPVEQSGAPTPPGTPSHKLRLTNLYNHLLPLIRYELEDSVTPSDPEDACGCGISFRRIESVNGRSHDIFAYDAGVRVHPLVFCSILGRRPSIAEYQIVQTTCGADIRVRTTGAFDRSRLGQEVAAALREQGIAKPIVAVCCVDQIERTALGKLKRFIPLASTSERATERVH
jgi:phenylacetate-coenzyme A ligase PaaK-like adenylate-forming protein